MGKVQGDDQESVHTLACQMRNRNDSDRDFVDVLYLFRQFESEAIRLLLPVDTLTSNAQLHSFIAALQLGLKRYFKGSVDHLKTLINQEPQGNSPLRRPFLFLYDTIPGGSGYLQQLAKEPDNLFAVFQEALKVLVSCTCNDGCYNCLYAYRNSFDQDQTSRQTAIALLNQILSRRDRLQPDQKGLSTVKLNSLFDSILEKKFIEVLGKYHHQEKPVEFRQEVVNGKSGYFLTIGDFSWNIELQVELGPSQNVAIPSRADFVFYPTKSSGDTLPVVVFTDGWQYHCDRLGKDFAQRLAIAQSSNYWVWSLSWQDVETLAEKKKSHDYFTDFLRNPVNNQFKAKFKEILKQYDCPIAESLSTENSFTWLLTFLANPDRTQWQRFALMSTLAHIDPMTSKDPTYQQQWLQELNKAIAPEIWQDYSTNTKPDWFGRYPYKTNDDLPLVQIFTAASRTHHKNRDPEGSFVLLWFSDLLKDTQNFSRGQEVDATSCTAKHESNTHFRLPTSDFRLSSQEVDASPYTTSYTAKNESNTAPRAPRPTPHFQVREQEVEPTLKGEKKLRDVQSSYQILSPTFSLQPSAFINNSPQLQRLWNGTLRHYNLMQFLPHTYILTSSSDYSWLSPKKNSVQVGAGEKEWQERESLIFAEEAIALVQQMKLHQWSLPSVGYELSAGKKVIGEAEFAWEARQVALVLDEVNLHAFQEAGWQVAIIAEILDNPEVFRQENNL